MTDSPLTALLVEDNPADARLILELLRADHGNRVRVQAAETLEGAVQLVGAGGFDVAILDLNLPDSTGLDTLKAMQSACPSLPIVVLTGRDDEDFATTAVQQGAQDYLLKGRIEPDLLVRSMLYAIERKRAEERLQQLNEELENRVRQRTAELSDLVGMLEEEIAERKRAERHKDEFIGVVSHELRTPLSIVSEAVHLLLDLVPGELTEEQTHILTIARRNSDRLIRLINDLLNMSTIATGRVRLEHKQVDLCALVREVVSTFEMRAARRGLTLTADFAREPIELSIDPDCIMEVLTNLVGNSLKFTEHGGVSIRVIDRDDRIECSVTDTGLGFPEDALDKAFDKFEQFHRVPGSGEKGTGLGLAISKGIIELHGGTIRLVSREGQGSTFTFVLPKAPPEDVLIRQRRPEPQPEPPPDCG